MPRRTFRSERSNRGGSSVVSMQSGGSGSSKFPGSTIDLNFTNGQYFGVTGSPATFLTTTRASNKTNLFPTSVSGFAYSTFTNNVPAITSGSGLSVEEARTNVLLNSAAPVTQTTASLGTGVYTLWVNGSGSATSSAGSATITGAGAATNGTPNVFTVTVAGTVTITVSGSLNAFQCELGTWGTSLIVTAGATATRAADVITLTSPPAFGAATSLFAQFTPQAPVAFVNPQFAIQADDGTNTNRIFLRRESATGFATWRGIGGTGWNVSNNSQAVNIRSKIAGAAVAGDQAGYSTGGISLGTAAAAVMPATETVVRVGSEATNITQLNGFLERIAIWPTTRISNTTLQTITT